MIPKGAIRATDGLYCKNCKTYIYGDPERIKPKHKCQKLVVRRKFLLFGKKIKKFVEIEGEPDFIPIRSYFK